jgi:hypothetical protein
MKLKSLAIAFSAAALSASVLSVNAAETARFGDENDLSWLPSRAQQSYTGTQRNANTDAQKPAVRFGDENDTSWVPGTKR